MRPGRESQQCLYGIPTQNFNPDECQVGNSSLGRVYHANAWGECFVVADR